MYGVLLKLYVRFRVIQRA